MLLWQPRGDQRRGLSGLVKRKYGPERKVTDPQPRLAIQALRRSESGGEQGSVQLLRLEQVTS